MEVTFLVSGIPREYDDLEGWTAFDGFLRAIDQDTDVQIHADAYLYGEGETVKAIATWLSGPSSALWLFFFPCAAIVVANEIYNFINGQTKAEFEHSVLGDESDARRVSNYYKLREILEQILPEPLLSAHTGCEFIGTQSPADLIKSMADSDDKTNKVIADYFQADGRYIVANVDCVQATVQMMKRRNVVFFNPFYRDLEMYITLPIITTMLSGKKCVVLCGRKSAAEDVKVWISDLLEEYSHMQSMWRVNLLSDKEPECEVGIITFTQLYDKRVINTNREFLNETDFVLIIEPSLMLNTSQVALSILAEEMQLNDEKPVYCIKVVEVFCAQSLESRSRRRMANYFSDSKKKQIAY